MNSGLPQIPTRKYIELDSLRFFAVLFVLLHHLHFSSNSFFNWFNKFGSVGVDIFFVISGFIITHSLLNAEKKRKISYKNFLIRRAIRLWPSWLLALLFSFVITYYFGLSNQSIMDGLMNKYWHYLLHFANYSIAYFGKIHDSFSHFWSLAVEEHFYIFWPIIFIASSLRPKIRTASLLSLIIIPLLFRLINIWYPPESVKVILMTTHNRFDGLAMGCLLACFYQNIPQKLNLKYEIIITILAVATFYLGLNVMSEINTYIALKAFNYSLTGIGSCLLILLALNGNQYGLRTVLKSKFLAFLGILSYGVYLFHVHWNIVFYASIKKLTPTFDNHLLIAIINCTVPFFIAMIFYYLIDKNLEKLKSKFKV